MSFVDYLLNLTDVKFGIYANLIDPSLSIIISILLVIGTGAIGKRVLCTVLPSSVKQLQWLPFQSPVVGAALVSWLAHSLALAGLLTRSVASLIAISLIIIGIFVLAKSRSIITTAHSHTSRWFHQLSVIDAALVSALTLGLALLTLPLPTDDDTMAYHFGVAIATINSGHMPVAPEWFHSRLAGAGESLTGVGLAIGATQFLPLLQFVALIGLLTIILQHVGAQSSTWTRGAVALSILSLPILIAWSNSAKPLLLPVLMTTVSLAMTIQLHQDRQHSNDLNIDSQLKSLIVICCLASMAGVFRMNYLPSGALIVLGATIVVGRYTNRLHSLIILIIAGSAIVLPSIIWKAYHFNASFLAAAFTPFPGELAGSYEFIEFLQEYRDSSFIFPLNLLVPDSLGSITTVLGIGVGLPLLLIRKPTSEQIIWVGAALISSVILTASTLFNSRFFLEPFLWALIAVAKQSEPRAKAYRSFIHWATRVQAILSLSVIVYGNSKILPAAFTTELRDRVMASVANGYQEMVWADRALPKDSRLLVMTRYMSLAPRSAISGEWRRFIDPISTDATEYLKKTRDFQANFALLRLASNQAANVTKCGASVFRVSPLFAKATRNPVNSGAEYRAWLIRVSPNTDLACLLTRQR